MNLVLVSVIIVVMGLIAVFYGSFKYANAAGNPKDVHDSGNILGIGFFVIFTGIMLLTFSDMLTAHFTEAIAKQITADEKTIVEREGRGSAQYYCEVSDMNDGKEYRYFVSSKEEAKEYCDGFEKGKTYEVTYKEYGSYNYIENEEK